MFYGNTKALVTVTVEVAYQQFEDLVVTALEGGIGYWARLNNDNDIFEEYHAMYPDDAVSQVAAKILWDDKVLQFTDEEDGETYTLTKGALLESFVREFPEVAQGNSDRFDGLDADIVVQMAIFGELTFA